MEKVEFKIPYTKLQFCRVSAGQKLYWLWQKQ